MNSLLIELDVARSEARPSAGTSPASSTRLRIKECCAAKIPPPTTCTVVHRRWHTLSEAISASTSQSAVTTPWEVRGNTAQQLGSSCVEAHRLCHVPTATVATNWTSS